MKPISDGIGSWRYEAGQDKKYSGHHLRSVGLTQRTSPLQESVFRIRNYTHWYIRLACCDTIIPTVCLTKVFS